MTPISLKDALHYEIKSSWIVPLVSSQWLQNVLGKYYARRVKRKYKRYIGSVLYGSIVKTDLK